MEILIKIIGLSCMTYLFVNSEPLILIKRGLGFKEEEYYDYGKIKGFIYRLITCCLCSGFWIGLIFTLNIYEACVIAIISELINKILQL